MRQATQNLGLACHAALCRPHCAWLSARLLGLGFEESVNRFEEFLTRFEKPVTWFVVKFSGLTGSAGSTFTCTCGWWQAGWVCGMRSLVGRQWGPQTWVWQAMLVLDVVCSAAGGKLAGAAGVSSTMLLGVSCMVELSKTSLLQPASWRGL